MDQQETEVNAINQLLLQGSDFRLQGLKVLAAMIARRHIRLSKDLESSTNDTGHDDDAIDVKTAFRVNAKCKHISIRNKSKD